MSSWVRYSVAVYAGLLLAGAAIAPQPQASVGSDLLHDHTARAAADACPHYRHNPCDQPVHDPVAADDRPDGSAD